MRDVSPQLLHIPPPQLIKGLHHVVGLRHVVVPSLTTTMCCAHGCAITMTAGRVCLNVMNNLSKIC